MTRQAPDRNSIAPLLDAIRSAVPDVKGIWLFGSLARDQAGPESDIDLAVLAGEPLDPVRMFDLGLELGVLASRDVDLIDLRRVSTIMRKEVVSEGQLVLIADARACEAFVADSLALYVALRDEQLLLARVGKGRS